MADIPLFPLPMVLFPGGRTTLKIFESRYLDMIKRCLKDEVGFGVVLIEEGGQVLEHPEQQLPSIARCGTYCDIVDFDQQEQGFLEVTIEGRIKFSIRDDYETPERLMMASVEFLPLEDEAEVPDNKQHLVSLLESLTRHESIAGLGLAVDFEDARDVSARLAEYLPCSNTFKQKMLEIRNASVRLVELEKLVVKLQNSDPY